jgi:RNA polymerase sigma-70 factor (ECF subfamily)
VELSPIDSPLVGDMTSSINDRDQLDRGFSRLEPEARALIVLHHYLDLPLPEVANVLGIPLGTAKSRLHRALQSMRAVLDADARPTADVAEGRLA